MDAVKPFPLINFLRFRLQIWDLMSMSHTVTCSTSESTSHSDAQIFNQQIFSGKKE